MNRLLRHWQLQKTCFKTFFSLVSVFYVFSLFTGASILTKGQLNHSTTKEEANMSVSGEFTKLNLIWKDWASTKLIAKLLLRLNWKTREVLKSAYSSEFHRPPDHDQLQHIPSPIISDKMLKENDRQSERSPIAPHIIVMQPPSLGCYKYFLPKRLNAHPRNQKNPSTAQLLSAHLCIANIALLHCIAHVGHLQMH